MKYVIAAAFFLILVGCATTPLPTDEALQVPSTRVLQPSALNPTPGFGSITIKRDVGAMNWICNTTISVDLTPIAIVDRGEKLSIYLAPGTHILAVSSNFGCGGDVVEEKIDVHTDMHLTLRIGFGSNKGLFFKPSAL